MYIVYKTNPPDASTKTSQNFVPFYPYFKALFDSLTKLLYINHANAGIINTQLKILFIYAP